MNVANGKVSFTFKSKRGVALAMLGLGGSVLRHQAHAEWKRRMISARKEGSESLQRELSACWAYLKRTLNKICPGRCGSVIGPVPVRCMACSKEYLRGKPRMVSAIGLIGCLFFIGCKTTPKPQVIVPAARIAPTRPPMPKVIKPLVGDRMTQSYALPAPQPKRTLTLSWPPADNSIFGYYRGIPVEFPTQQEFLIWPVQYSNVIPFQWQLYAEVKATNSVQVVITNSQAFFRVLNPHY